MTIWKYPLTERDGQSLRLALDMPEGARPLSAQMQDGALCLWAMVDPERGTSTRRFRVVMTGEPVDDFAPLRYIGTFQAGWFVGHLFEDVGEA